MIKLAALVPLWPYDLLALLFLPALHFALKRKSEKARLVALYLFCLADFAGWLVYICALGALAALLFPSTTYIGQVWAPITASFFVNHYSILAIPILLATWGFYRPEPTPGRLAELSVLVFATAAMLMALPWNWRRWFGAGTTGAGVKA